MPQVPVPDEIEHQLVKFLTRRINFSAQQRPIEPRRPLPTKKVVLKATPAPVAPPKVTKPPVRRPAARRPETDSSLLSSSLAPRQPSPPRPSSPGWKEQLLKERKQFEQQLEEMAKQQAEHCAKFHPPPCPKSAKGGKKSGVSVRLEGKRKGHLSNSNISVICHLMNLSDFIKRPLIMMFSHRTLVI